MKKIFSTVLACLLICCGIFAMSGCENNIDMNGIYRLNYAIWVDEGSNEIKAESKDTSTIETYIKIDGLIITEYKFEKSSTSPKKLIEQNVLTQLALPPFERQVDGKNEYFHDYTNLNRYTDNANLSKIERWTYVRVSSLPTTLQGELVAYFGDYNLTSQFVGGVQVSTVNNVTLNLNGKLTIKSKIGEQETKVVYDYVELSQGVYRFKSDSAKLNLIVQNGKIKTFAEGANPDTDYSMYDKKIV